LSVVSKKNVAKNGTIRCKEGSYRYKEKMYIRRKETMKKIFFMILLGTMGTLLISNEQLYAQMQGRNNDGYRRGHLRDKNEMGPHHRPRGPKERMFFGDPAMMKEQLGLSDTQVEKISDINLNYRKQHLYLKEKLDPKRTQLKRLLLEENVDLTKVRKLLEEIASIQVDMRMLMIKQRLEIERVLTSKQRKKMRQFKGRGGPGGRFGMVSPAASMLESCVR
jgi:Spy/CpxP family protein refolding chaperone